MIDIYNEITTVLIVENLESYIQLGAQCLLFGFTFYSLLSLLAYGISKAIGIVNIKAY